MTTVRDDADRMVTLQAPPRRMVSLVPSLTETLFALGAGDAVVGVTRFCVAPDAAGGRWITVGGTKDPDCEAIRRLAPDLVIVNAEENRREDCAQLERWGLRVFVTFPKSVDDTVGLLRRLGEVTGCVARGRALADDLAATVAEVRERVRSRRRVFCPIWKNPWMTIAAGTYADDVLWTAGGDNIFRDQPTPYPRITLSDAAQRRPEIVLLPDEPYRFSRHDLADLAPLRGAPAAPADRIHFVDGKALSWYGARTAAGVRSLAVVLG